MVAGTELATPGLLGLFSLGVRRDGVLESGGRELGVAILSAAGKTYDQEIKSRRDTTARWHNAGERVDGSNAVVDCNINSLQGWEWYWLEIGGEIGIGQRDKPAPQ